MTIEIIASILCGGIGVFGLLRGWTIENRENE